MDVLWFLVGFLAAWLLAGVAVAILTWQAFAAVDPPREAPLRCWVCGREVVSPVLFERHLRWHRESVDARPGHGSPPSWVVREAEEIVRRRQTRGDT